ncbi:unnamed protein product [Caenorhabditis sp. 36 PRJEB53466]|nr:unnamed protein product [Caenorhabditis sp. 36 PRJEB53466]
MADAEQKTLLSLPSELLCHLFTYLPPRQLITQIPLVCSRFNNILKDDKFWSGRIKNEHQVRVPDCELKHLEYKPQKSFYAMSCQRERWRDWETQTVITAPGHSATVDSVMLFQRNDKEFCLSGSRDRTIRLWNLENVRRGEDSAENQWTVAKDETAHSGWIWNMTRDESTSNFYTTSWDSSVKSWNITEDGQLRNVSSVNVGSAAQCISCAGNEHEVVCTTFVRRMAIIDSRTFEVVAEHKLHKKAVLALAVQGDKIFTSGEDRLMMMVDRRNLSRPVLFEYSQTAYKSCLSLRRNQLLTATSDGGVKLYDANNFNVLQSYNVGSFTRQALLGHGAHLVMARSLKRNFKFSIHSPGSRSQKWCESHELAAEPAKFDYSFSTRTLAIGNGDSSILFCLPGAQE